MRMRGRSGGSALNPGWTTKNYRRGTMGNTTNPYGMVVAQARSAAIVMRFHEGGAADEIPAIIDAGQMATLCSPPQCRLTGFFEDEVGVKEPGFARGGLLLSMELIGGPHDGEYAETHASWGMWIRVNGLTPIQRPEVQP